MEERDIAVRCFTRPVENNRRHSFRNDRSIPTFERYLVLDTETTVDTKQSLKFGSAILMIHGRVSYRWIFYDERNVTIGDIAILESFEGCLVMKVNDFVERVLLKEIYDIHTPLIGFNLPFDLSRLAIKVGYGRKRGRGGFSFTLSPSYPHLLIKHINSKHAQIKFMKGRIDGKNNFGYDKGSQDFPGIFVDLRTLTFALTNESYSLDEACKRFGAAQGKLEVKQHGKVTREYVEYNLNDVVITHQLFQNVMKELDKYGLDVDVTRLVSPASIGKAYLTAMGVRSFVEKNPDFSPELLGKIMETYYGGRSEVRVRLEPRHIRLLDFLSMYPTMCGLLGIWEFIVSDHIDCIEVTNEVQNLLDNITRDDLRDKIFWKNLNVICEVVPDEDIFTVRSDFNGVNYNLANVYLTSNEPLSYTLADVVASKLLTGKNPKILKAVRFVPVGVQDGLRLVRIIGEQWVDPVQDDFFIALSCHRHSCKKKKEMAEKEGDLSSVAIYNSIQNATKTILNSTSYGIFVQENVIAGDGDVEVFGHGPSFESKQSVIERPGPFFNPIIGTMVTAAARLVLAIAESILNDHGAMYAFCDTDSMAVPSEHVEEIQSHFRILSPYPFEAELFKLEKENFDDGGNLVDLQFIGVSAKRYVLFYEKDGQFVIQKASNHGLGHIRNPFKMVDDKEWIDEVWMDFLNLYYNRVSDDELSLKYSDCYALSSFTVNTPQLLERLSILNAAKDYNDRIKPFNFCILGVANQRHERSDRIVKPLAPFKKRAQEVVHMPFIDYNTGKILNGIEYWKPIEDVLFRHTTHPESKFDGEIGELVRRHVRVKSIACIGKESNNLERSRYFGICPEDLITYDKTSPTTDAVCTVEGFLLSLTDKEAKRYNINPRELARWKAKIRDDEQLKFQAGSKARVIQAMNSLSVKGG